MAPSSPAFEIRSSIGFLQCIVNLRVCLSKLHPFDVLLHNGNGFFSSHINSETYVSDPRIHTFFLAETGVADPHIDSITEAALRVSVQENTSTTSPSRKVNRTISATTS